MCQWVVVMIEPGHPEESLTAKGELNEVFGPFDTDDEAHKWTHRMANVYRSSRDWVIMPLSSPKVVLNLDVESN